LLFSFEHKMYRWESHRFS